MTSFKNGAFIARKAVLPVALNWNRNKYCDLSYVSNRNELAMLIHVGFCQFINYCDVYINDVYKPNENEKRNLYLFGNNVRNVIAKSLKKGLNTAKGQRFECTPHSYADYVLFMKSVKSSSMNYNNSFYNSNNFVVGDIVSLLNLKTDTISYLSRKFEKLDLNNDGLIDFNEFCIAFDRDPKIHEQQMKPLFNLFNKIGDNNNNNNNVNAIGFNEFLAGVSVCFMDNMINDAIKIVFSACSMIENSGNIKKSNDDKENKENKENSEAGTDEVDEVDEVVRRVVTKKSILSVYQRNVSIEKFDIDYISEGYKVWFDKMKKSLNIIFKNENVKLDLNQFYEKIINNQLEFVIQHFLQCIIIMKLKIKLDKNDFLIKKNDEKDVFVAPATRFVRSSSIVGVKQLI